LHILAFLLYDASAKAVYLVVDFSVFMVTGGDYYGLK
jgi:hypothetical protein